MARMLIAYYSWSNGNTERIAQTLADATGADVIRIQTAEPYPEDYDTTVAQAQDEVNAGFQPELADLGCDPDDYDVVAVGTPTWWYTMAPAARSFLAGRSWAGKTIVPFMTNAGWPGTVIDDMEELCEGAAVIEPLEVTFDSDGGDRMRTKEGVVKAWASRVGEFLSKA